MNSAIIWLQAVAYLFNIVFAIGGACAFLFVMWPAIRRQNRMADRFDAFIESPEWNRFLELARGADLKAVIEYLKKLPDVFKGGVVSSIKGMIDKL